VKILFVNHNIMGRGTYVRCLQLASGLVTRGHEVHLLTSSLGAGVVTHSMVNGVHIHAFHDVIPGRARNGGLGILDTSYRAWYVLTNRFDLIHAFDHRPTVSIPALIGKYLRGTPLVSEWTDWWGFGGIMDERPKSAQRVFGAAETASENELRRRADALTIICEGLQRRATSLEIDSPMLRLPGGADVVGIRPEDTVTCKISCGIESNRPVIAYMGFTQYDRAYLLECFRLVAARNPHVILLLIGPKSTDLEAHPASERIIQSGAVFGKSLGLHLGAADVLLLPFRNRGVNLGRWPQKVGDYMAAGRAIVANRTGDLIELFDSHSIGVLADDSVESFAEATLALLADPDRCESLGKQARHCAETSYSWLSLSAKLDLFYGQILQEVCAA
jgi:glycosyltransferase involved in cell wall biosynthesis